MKGKWVLRLSCLAASVAICVALMPPAQAQNYTVLHNFAGPDGAWPPAGLTIDRAGNLYGTAPGGGNSGSNCYDPYGGSTCGTVFRLSHHSSGWIFQKLYAFSGSDGANSEARVIIGPDGNLYGTTVYGGLNQCLSYPQNIGCGTVFRLSPPPSFCASISCPWRETVLYAFQGNNDNDGQWPQLGDLLFDPQGNIYGTTPFGGGNYICTGGYCQGVVFELSPSAAGWTENILSNFAPLGGIPSQPYSGVIFDHAGNLYGTYYWGGNFSRGGVYDLSPAGDGWNLSVLYDFGWNAPDSGTYPIGGLIFDATGNVYGATTQGGANGGGTVYEFSPASQQINVLCNFSAPPYGVGGSFSTLLMDSAGNLYGTTALDGQYGYGAVFKLSQSGDTWTYTSLHDFTGGQDGGVPSADVVLDANGNVYGTTNGGGANGKGVIFEITP